MVVSSIALLLGWVVSPDATSSAAELPLGGVAPIERDSPRPSPPTATVPTDGVEPLDHAPASSPAEPPVSSLPVAGTRPLPYVAPKDEPSVDPKTTRMVRQYVMLGPAWRIRPVDTLFTTGATLGYVQGLSGSVHASMIMASDRRSVQAFDFPFGVGVVLRGRLGDRSVYGSVGFSAGLLVHRARTDQGVQHRVDPDLRLPLRFEWTIARSTGLSLAFVPGYSVRERTYLRRGGAVWTRSSVRLGLLIGLHWDIVEKRAKARPRDRRRGGEQ